MLSSTQLPGRFFKFELERLKVMYFLSVRKSGNSRQRGQPVTFAAVIGHEGKKIGQIACIGGDCIVRGTFERALMVKPRLQGIARGRRDQTAFRVHDNQRRMARSNTPAKKLSRSVPCCGENICGSSAPNTSRPGNRPSPRSSFRQASERIQSD